MSRRGIASFTKDYVLLFLYILRFWREQVTFTETAARNPIYRHRYNIFSKSFACSEFIYREFPGIVRIADRILALEDGQIVAAASHRELPIYGDRNATLFEMQAGCYGEQD